MATQTKPDMTTPFDPAQWMQVQLIDADCIRLSHDFGFCHLTPGEVMQLIAHLGNAVANAGNVRNQFSVEPHGDGYAIYTGRDDTNHGSNLGHLSECSDWLPKHIERALNAATRTSAK